MSLMETIMRTHLKYLLIALMVTSSGCRCGVPSSTVSKQVDSTRGARVEIKGVATLLISTGAVSNKSVVELKAVKSKDAMETFDQTAGSVLPPRAVRSPYIITVNTGREKPRKNIELVVSIPPELKKIRESGKGATISVYAEYVEGSGSELHDAFSEEDYTTDPQTGNLKITLDSALFSEIHRTDGTFETRILVVAIPSDIK